MDTDVRSNTLSLPQELIHSVVDHLHGDKAALFNASLISRSWTISTRSPLFRTIAIVGTSKIQSFIDLLYHPQFFASHIQNLHLLGRSDPSATATWNFVPGDDKIDSLSLALILSKLSAIKTLHLSSLCWQRTKNSGQAGHLLVSQPPPINLNSLHLHNLFFDGSYAYEGFIDLMRLFSVVDELCHKKIWLTSDSSSFSIDSDFENLVIPQHLQIQSLSFDAQSDWFPLEVIRKSGPCASLIRVDLAWSDWPSLVAIGALLRDRGQGVREIVLWGSMGFWSSPSYGKFSTLS